MNILYEYFQLITYENGASNA